jgi:hypothetical protein
MSAPLNVLALGSGKIGVGTKSVTIGAADDDSILTGFAGPDTTTVTKAVADFVGATGVVSGALGRRIIVTVTHATSVVVVDGTITGTDLDGAAQTETWAVTATGTSKTYVGVKTFLTVSSITFHATANASADTIKVGIQNSRRLTDTSIDCVGVWIQALSGNSGSITVGNTEADMTAASAKGIKLAANATIYLPVYNLMGVGIDPSLTGEGVSFLYLY